jgi:hypothetical protein
MRYKTEDIGKAIKYDPETGRFTWLVNLAGRGQRAGGAAGSINKNSGYLVIGFAGKKYFAHRVAWLLMTGAHPAKLIDHKDMDKANNSWDNLRLATNGQNHINSGVRSDNSHGARGVKLHRRKEALGHKPWQAVIGVGGKCISLGYFKEKTAAQDAYQKASVKYYGEYSPYF